MTILERVREKSLGAHRRYFTWVIINPTTWRYFFGKIWYTILLEIQFLFIKKDKTPAAYLYSANELAEIESERYE